MNSIKQLSAMLIFVEIAKRKSFTNAAKHLGMSKSAVSQQLTRLEREIGQQLMSRHTRAMSLTAAGKKLLMRCELLRDQVQLALNELEDNKRAPSGRFSLTIPHSFENEIALPALSQLCTEFPLLEPDLVVTDNVKDLIQDKFDLSIFGGELKDSHYRALPIGAAREVFCASPVYLHKAGAITAVEQLGAHRAIATAWQNGQLEINKHNNLIDHELLNLNYSAKTNTLPSAIEMVCQGIGIALLPEFAIQSQLTNGRLVRVLPKYQGKQWSFYMVHRFHGEKPIHITRFYELIKHFFSKTNPTYRVLAP